VKDLYVDTKLHGIISLKILILIIFIAVRTRNSVLRKFEKRFLLSHLGMKGIKYEVDYSG
jgi:hypothetical protein